jgi:hypothetical protein
VSTNVIESKNMRLIAHNDLAGFGGCGEGIAMHVGKNGRRTLFMAQCFGPGDFTGVDVTDPKNPKTICQTTLPHSDMRSNSLMIVGDTMAVCRQVNKIGMKPAGLELFDISQPDKPKSLSFYDTSGPNSPGAHYVWFVDGKYAYLSSGTPDFDPISHREAWMVLILDVEDPTKPQEVGRWWLPGTSKSDKEPPPPGHADAIAAHMGIKIPPRDERPTRYTVNGVNTMDVGSRVHDVYVYPQRPDRCYVSYLDSGAVILDISDKSKPQMISQFDYHPPAPGHTHTAMPLFGPQLLAITEESLTEDCYDHPKMLRFADISYEPKPLMISAAPLPDKEPYCGKGRFGAHNIYDNPPVAGSWASEEIIVGCFFSVGIRAYDIRNPYRPEEIGYLIPETPDGIPAIQMNDLHIDENAMIYAIDRAQAGLYVVEWDI